MRPAGAAFSRAEGLRPAFFLRGSAPSGSAVYAELGALNSFQVVAVDEEGNQSSPATYIVDLR